METRLLTSMKPFERQPSCGHCWTRPFKFKSASTAQVWTALNSSFAAVTTYTEMNKASLAIQNIRPVQMHHVPARNVLPRLLRNSSDDYKKLVDEIVNKLSGKNYSSCSPVPISTSIQHNLESDALLRASATSVQQSKWILDSGACFVQSS